MGCGRRGADSCGRVAAVCLHSADDAIARMTRSRAAGEITSGGSQRPRAAPRTEHQNRAATRLLKAPVGSELPSENRPGTPWERLEKLVRNRGEFRQNAGR